MINKEKQPGLSTWATWALAIGLISACTAPLQTEVLQSEEWNEAYAIECNGLRASWSDCLSQADQLCPTGYKKLLEETSGFSIPTIYGGSIPVTGQRLEIACTP
jgi:hypothetical protein